MNIDLYNRIITVNQFALIEFSELICLASRSHPDGTYRPVQSAIGEMGDAGQSGYSNEILLTSPLSLYQVQYIYINSATKSKLFNYFVDYP